MRPTAAAAFAVVASVAVLAAVAVGLWLVGPPSQVRAQRLDSQRISAIESLAEAIQSYQADQGALPDSLDALLRKEVVIPGEVQDPGAVAAYEYHKTGTTTFQLCARFDASSGSEEAMRWRHAAGRSCFDFTVEPGETGRTPSASGALRGAS